MERSTGTDGAKRIATALSAGSTEETRTEVFLCGDVMTGRGIDQILQYPSNPVIYEGYMKSAEGYVRIAEDKLGHKLPRRVSDAYVWGDALQELQKRPSALRIINLETSVTVSETHWPGKGIQYRMHPKNVGVLRAAGVDCCVLSNNHVLDWGYEGLQETLSTLRASGIHVAGAGEDIANASRPAVMTSSAGHAVVVLGIGLPSAGVPPQWAASRNRAGVNFCGAPGVAAVEQVKAQLSEHLGKPNTIVVVSVHWGPNWGYEVTDEERRFAHDLIDAGVHVVHGHSSHHVKGLELHRNQLILYGCGDFLNDYEGIGHHSGEEQFRSDLCLMYFVTFAADGHLTRIQLVPMQVQKLQLQRPPPDALDWMCATLSRESAAFGSLRVVKNGDGVSLDVLP